MLVLICAVDRLLLLQSRTGEGSCSICGGGGGAPVSSLREGNQSPILLDECQDCSDILEKELLLDSWSAGLMYLSWISCLSSAVRYRSPEPRVA